MVGYVMDPNDAFLHLADLGSYIRTHDAAVDLYARPNDWTPKAILNVARMGPFSSDRTVRDYAKDIWHL
jgi:starch phosphorylase